MTFIKSSQIILFFLIIHSSTQLNSHFKKLLVKSLIQRRQVLDGTAKSGGVAPKPPGSDNVFSNDGVTSLTQKSTTDNRLSMTTKIIINNESADDRSIKDTVSTTSSSKAGLIASIVAPTGILGLIGAAVGAFFFKKNQTNSSTNDATGFLSKLFSGNSNAIRQNKSEEIYIYLLGTFHKVLPLQLHS
jgi:hypothetical protein